MTTLYITKDHAFVRKQGGSLLVKSQDGETDRLPLERIDQVVCAGDISWSGAALRELAEHGIGVAYLGPRGEWVGRWEPKEAKTVPLRRVQYRASDDLEQSLKVSGGFIDGKIRNCRSLLQRARRDGLLTECPEIDALGRLRTLAEKASTLDALRGIEGEAAATYFRAYGRIVSRHGFEFTTRVRRPPNNPINALLSFGYALLTASCASAARTVGFDAHIGFLHRDRYGRESLALDLCEEFRPIIVDALVAGIVNRRVLRPDDFEINPTSVMLQPAARRRYLELYSRKLADEIQHPVLRVRVSHQRAIELQARALAKVLTGELERYIPFSKR